MIGFLTGAAVALAGATVGARALRRQRGERYAAAARDPRCEVAIVLFAPADPAAVLIDRTTGSLGFSHAAIQGCEVTVEGEPLLLDCQAGLGVTRRPESVYGGRRRSYVVLLGPAAAELYGCARARVGADFAPAGDGYLCAQFVAGCLPADLRRRVEGARSFAGPGGIPTPNQIAAAFGVRPGQDVVV